LAARSLNRSGERRSQAEEALRQTNEALETRVIERTAQLEASQAREISELRAAEEQIQAFANLAQRLNSVTTPREAAGIVLEAADELLGWQCAYLDLYSAERDRLHSVLNLDEVQGRRVEVPPVGGDEQPGPMTRRILTQGGQLILRTAEEAEQRADPDNLQAFGDTSRRSASLMFVPIRYGQRSTGILSIQSYRLAAYDQDSLNTLQALADHAAGALNRIRTQIELQESEARIRAINDASPSGIFVTDAAGEVVYTNRAYQAITGLTFEATLGRGWSAAVHEEDREPVVAEWYTAARGSGVFERDFRFMRPDGTTAWASVKAAAIRDGENLLGYVGTVENITERRQQEAALRESEARYRYIVDHANDLIYETGADGRVTAFNPTALRLLKFTREELLGRPYLEFVHPDHRRHAERIYGRQFLKRIASSYEEILAIDKHGQALWLGQQVQLVMEGDRPAGFQVVARDITARKQAEQALQAANDNLTIWVNQLERRNQAISLLSHMGGLLQACQTQEEAFAVFTEMLGRLFPVTAGALYVLSASRDLLEAVAVWGQADGMTPMFAPDDCWALRRGRVHQSRAGEPALPCRHTKGVVQGSLCVPMMALGDTLGVLYLQVGDPAGVPEGDQQVAVTVAEQAAMALSNLRLRESLRSQSIRDPLTTLFNRRYMEESLERELSRAGRGQLPVGVIMLDLDHYKRFNDTFGHAAGDTVLRELGAFLRAQLRGGDIACRYGGEEFTLILPDCSLENTRKRADDLRQGIKQLDVQHHGQSLGKLSVSMGVSAFPGHGASAEALIQSADLALYHAKHNGRDRVEVAPVS
jgi:diguanylate cyclase (GGDEF)-like protein/PAS domain S-box-containing protein